MYLYLFYSIFYQSTFKSSHGEHDTTIAPSNHCSTSHHALCPYADRHRQLLQLFSIHLKQVAEDEDEVKSVKQLKESAVSQVVLNDDVGYGIHHEFHVTRVGSTCEVRVDVFCSAVPVQIFELTSDIRTSLVISVTS